MSNKKYFEKKRMRADVAKEHTLLMESEYFGEITNCVDNTKFYDSTYNFAMPKIEDVKPKISLIQMDTVSAAFKFVNKNQKTAILNFASYRYPGGGYMSGSNAQEENLCQSSFLYNILREFDDTYYDRNRRFLNNCLYTNRALYTPNVRFFNAEKESAKFDVLTCAAPNYSVACEKVSKQQNDQCLRERIRFVLQIAKHEQVDQFIVGAWGCGVFKQDPKLVAQYFKDEAREIFAQQSIHLIFAIISKQNDNENYIQFKNILEVN